MIAQRCYTWCSNWIHHKIHEHVHDFMQGMWCAVKVFEGILYMLCTEWQVKTMSRHLGGCKQVIAMSAFFHESHTHVEVIGTRCQHMPLLENSTHATKLHHKGRTVWKGKCVFWNSQTLHLIWNLRFGKMTLCTWHGHQMHWY